MLIFNRYLEEIGVTKDTYPLGKSCTHDNKLDKESGVAICHTWSLDVTLAMELYTYIRAYKDNTAGFPACMESFEEWEKILDEIADGFADYIKQCRGNDYKIRVKKLNRSLTLLKKYWQDLWW